MGIRIKLIISISIVSILMASCGIQSHIEKSKGIDLYNYKTYSWNNPNNYINKKEKGVSDIIDENIRTGIDEQMQKKGFTLTDKKPNLIIEYKIAQIKKTRQTNNSNYNQPIYGMRMRMYGVRTRPAQNRYQNYTEGELTVNMIDAKNNKLIWQGWALDAINEKTVSSKQIQKDIKAIFKKLK